eukprot:m.78102 g.78102  ORF g.78102 m.78102 type:complete len:99 (+) comp16218_c0_seq3:181-477(+)
MPLAQERSIFEACFNWKCAGNATGIVATLILFLGGILTMISTSADCWAVGLYMLIIAFVVGTLEAPPLMTLCGMQTWLFLHFPWLSAFSTFSFPLLHH